MPALSCLVSCACGLEYLRELSRADRERHAESRFVLEPPKTAAREWFQSAHFLGLSAHLVVFEPLGALVEPFRVLGLILPETEVLQKPSLALPEVQKLQSPGSATLGLAVDCFPLGA